MKRRNTCRAFPKNTAILNTTIGLAAVLSSLWLPSGAAAALLTQVPNPVLPHGATWDQAYAYGPKVVRVMSTNYMFYCGYANTGPTGDWNNIALATSTNGLDWTKVGPLIDATLPWEGGYVSKPTVVHLNGTFHMWYHCNLPVTTIGYAQSTNGLIWTKHSTPVLVPRPGKLDSQGLGGPTVVWRDGKFHMLYDAADDTLIWRTGYASSTDGTNWARSDIPVTGLPTGAACWLRRS